MTKRLSVPPVPVPPPSTIMTTGEAARLLGLSTTRLREFARLGKIPYESSEGGRMVFRRSDVDALRAARAAAGGVE